MMHLVPNGTLEKNKKRETDLFIIRLAVKSSNQPLLIDKESAITIRRLA
jgi:hypothetical protein